MILDFVSFSRWKRWLPSGLALVAGCASQGMPAQTSDQSSTSESGDGSSADGGDPDSGSADGGYLRPDFLPERCHDPDPVPGFGHTEVEVAVPGQISDMLVADLDGDGSRELLLADRQGNRVHVLSSAELSGTPTFRSFDVVQPPIAVAVGDLDGDGSLDLATANFGSTGARSGISVLTSDGAGGFDPPKLAAPMSTYVDVLIVETTGDQRLDVVAASDFSGEHGVVSFAGNGDGTLEPLTVVVEGRVTGIRRLEPFDAPEGPGLAVSAGEGETIAIFELPLSAAPVRQASVQLESWIQAFGTGDFDGDARVDLVANLGESALTTVWTSTAAGFAPPITFWASAVRWVSDVQVADLDGDARAEIVLADSDRAEIHTWRDGCPVFVGVVPLAPRGPFLIRGGRFDGDEADDLFVVSGAPGEQVLSLFLSATPA